MDRHDKNAILIVLFSLALAVSPLVLWTCCNQLQRIANE